MTKEVPQFKLKIINMLIVQNNGFIFIYLFFFCLVWENLYGVANVVYMRIVWGILTFLLDSEDQIHVCVFVCVFKRNQKQTCELFSPTP